MSETTSLHDLAIEIIEVARKRCHRLVTAESCAAGALSTPLADIPGAGDVLEGGFVSYAKSFKESVLVVDLNTLASESAVSESVALEMARGALRACPQADVAIAITGVCGPKPDDDGNPVGLAFIAIADRDERSQLKKLTLLPRASGRVRGEIMERGLETLAAFLSPLNGRDI